MRFIIERRKTIKDIYRETYRIKSLDHSRYISRVYLYPKDKYIRDMVLRYAVAYIKRTELLDCVAVPNSETLLGTITFIVTVNILRYTLTVYLNSLS